MKHSATLFSILTLFLSYTSHAAVVLVYHHVADDTPSSTSVSPKTFAAHLDYLAEQDFKVRSLAEILTTLKSGQALPDKTVAITFDDAYQSVHDTAMPLLAARGWPFTVFVNTQATSRESSLYMSWEELRVVMDNGGDVQNHSHTHASLAYPEEGESKDEWQARVRTDINTAHTSIRENLGVEPSLFAYPYGEYSPALQTLVSEMGLLGIGQHSGAVDTQSNFLGIPRHPFHKGADSIERFATRVLTRPLHLTITPKGPLRVERGSRVSLRIEGEDLTNTNCFFDGEPVLMNEGQLENLGPFNKRRTKLNCTRAMGAGVYEWFSYLFISY